MGKCFYYIKKHIYKKGAHGAQSTYYESPLSSLCASYHAQS